MFLIFRLLIYNCQYLNTGRISAANFDILKNIFLELIFLKAVICIFLLSGAKN